MHARCLVLLGLFAASWGGDSASAPAPAPSAGNAPTLPSLLALLKARERARPGTWTGAGNDIDHDARPSQMEILATLAGRPAWWRGACPEAFRQLDADHDNLLSRRELAAIADSAPGISFQIADRPRSLRSIGKPDQAQVLAAATPAGGTAGNVTAYAFFGRQYAYIADYNIVGGTYDPVIGVLGTGNAIVIRDLVITATPRR